MQEFVNAIKLALENENWYGALVVALILPDVCGNIQYPDMRPGDRYVKWFNKYLRCRYTHRVGASSVESIFLSGDDCYALRCSLLHEGRDNIAHQARRKDLNRFLFQASGSHCIYVNINNTTMLQLRVDCFCNDVCSAVEDWLKDVSGDKKIVQQMFHLVRVHPPGVVMDGIRFGESNAETNRSETAGNGVGRS